MNLTGTGCYKYEAKKKVFPSDEEIFAEILNKKLKNREGGSNQRLALILGIMAQNGEIVADPSGNRSKFSQKKYKFMLDCPYEISNKCCRVMKKEPAKRYGKETGRKPITGQMASESRLRYQKWMQEGCNAFDSKKQVSNPMSFWDDSDVLEYCKVNNIKLASVYGDIVEKQNEEEGQITMFGEPGGKKEYTTTGCKRTGCMFCGFGCHLEDSPSRFERLKETHPNIYEWIMSEQGLDYRNLINWLNEHGDMNIKY